MKDIVLQVHPSDNVLVALTNLRKAERIKWKDEEILLEDDIPVKHKLFTEDLSVGDKITMYGVTVGTAQEPVRKGGRMTVKNTQHQTDPYLYRKVNFNWEAPLVARFQHRTFKGYRRADGRVGTANYWIFIPTVFCENRNLEVIKEALNNSLGYSVTDEYRQFTDSLVEAYQEGKPVEEISFRQTSGDRKKRLFQNIDGIKFLNHSMGCGGTRQDAESLGRLLAAYADNPNVAGITLLSLGCQNLQVADFKQYLQERNPGFSKPLLIYEQQSSQSEKELIATSIRETFLELIKVNRLCREEVPLSELCIGVKCGGSDGFSGISANPAVGYCADLVVALGGKILLAEFPELCGAEQNLIDRCMDEESARKFIRLMTDYNNKAHAVGSGFHMNPSPGNIKDGLITDAIKSTGAALKGGTSPVVDVLDYTERATRPGLSLVCTPGNDVEATTGKAASGATVILFTTGLGTPTGNPICPTIKLSTNTSLSQRMRDIIDFDTGEIIEGTKKIQQVGEEILEYVIRVASGEETPKAVLLNQDDFIPWKRGVSL